MPFFTPVKRLRLATGLNMVFVSLTHLPSPESVKSLVVAILTPKKGVRNQYPQRNEERVKRKLLKSKCFVFVANAVMAV